MRKIAALASLFTLMSFSVIAQEAGKSRIGFKAGVNYSAVRFRVAGESSYSDYKTGLSLGFFREVNLSKGVAFQTEFMYNSLGGKQGGTTTRFGYLSLPLLFKFHGKHFGFMAGPQPSLLLSAKQEVEFVGTSDVKSSYKSIDLSGVTGVEYTFGKKGSYVAGLRYTFALNNIAKNVPGSGAYNYAWQGHIGFRF